MRQCFKFQESVNAMQIYQMLYFQKIAENGNLTKAAAELNMTPSALSGSLKRLEESLNVQLFDRVGKNLVINEYGKAYLPYVEKILTLNEKANEEIENLRPVVESSLMIADVTISFASKLISLFLMEHPEVTLQRTYISPSDGLPEHELHKYDFVIGSSNVIKLPGYERRIIRSGHEVSAIMNKSHPLAGADTLTMEDIGGEPMIAYSKGMPGRKMLDRIFTDAGKEYRIAFEANSPYSMAPALERNLGIFLQPRHTAEDNMHIYPGCVSIPIEGLTYEADTSVYFKSGHNLSRAALEFLDFVTEK